MHQRLSGCALWTGLSLLASPLLPAHTVTLAMDVRIDQVAPEDVPLYRVGGHDRDRLIYDEQSVDRRTQRVPVLAVEHYIRGHWMATPADAAMLDMSHLPYRLSFSAAVDHGGPILVVFEPQSQRMAIERRPDFHTLISGAYHIDPTPLSVAAIAAPPPEADSPDTMPLTAPAPGNGAAAHAHHVVALDVDILIDQTAPANRAYMGQHHNARLFYDEAAVDPASHHVVLLHLQHTPALIPHHLNPAEMPMFNAWLDLGARPLDFHYAAAPVSGDPDPYFILFDEHTRRMTIRRQTDGSVMLAGAYRIEPTRHSGPAIDAVVHQSDTLSLPWQINDSGNRLHEAAPPKLSNPESKH